jgi:subtilisin family serine protease
MLEQTTKTEDRPDASQLIGAGLWFAPASERYLLGTLRGAQVTVQEFERLVARLAQDPDVLTLKELRPSGQTSGFLGGSLAGPTRTVVLQLSASGVERVMEMIRANPALAGVVLEPDAPVTCGGCIRVQQSSSVLSPSTTRVTAEFTVIGKNDAPIEAAAVSLLGSFGAAQGLTDSRGRVKLTLFAESPPNLAALHVQPRADYWSYWIAHPAIDVMQPTRIRLAPLDQAFPQFPDQPLVGWGLKAMRLDELPTDQYDGRGVRVALVSSGCANRHRNLRNVEDGLQLTSSNSSAWSTDEMGYGTHCAGVIAAGHATAGGIRGIAPNAKLLVVKTAPDARVSDLIEAVDRSIERGADIICMTLGTADRSVLLEQKIAEAKSRGIACIAAAGDSGDSVQFPAASPDVLAVSAIGWRAAFPSDSQHALTVSQTGGTFDGYFAARFSCAGSQVDVCGPGVAIVSSVPPDNFAALDGTAPAAAHIAGLAALVLAHHPEFKQYAPYDARRPERLFEILKASAEPFRMGDLFHAGNGLPDGPRALNVAAPSSDRVEDRAMWPMLHGLAAAAQRVAPGGTAALGPMLEALARAGLTSSTQYGPNERTR